jgi:hypothetical protein
MEVHHHPNVEKKNFAAYFLEFLMIFLAVTMGFFAENIRESIVENHKEKEYIRSLSNDLEADTAKLNQGIQFNTEQSKGYDSLISCWYSKPYTDSSIRYMYYLYRKYTNTRHKVWFTHRTIDQLRNAGGMSLVQSKTASDSIINYYESVDRADEQIDIFTNVFRHEALQTSYRIFDWSLLKGINTSSVNKLLRLEKKFNFLNASISDQNTYIAELQVADAVLSNYIRMLSDERERCFRLISTLEKEYHLENK